MCNGIFPSCPVKCKQQITPLNILRFIWEPKRNKFVLLRRMSRIVAIDYGRKRTGVAVTDPMQVIANGLATVPTCRLMDFLLKYMQEEKVERIIIGHPKQMNNEDSENMKNIIPFVNRLKKVLPDIPVEWVDERFTSVLAHQAMLMGGLKKKDRQNKALVDEISATIILQSYLESKRIGI